MENFKFKLSFILTLSLSTLLTGCNVGMSTNSMKPGQAVETIGGEATGLKLIDGRDIKEIINDNSDLSYFAKSAVGLEFKNKVSGDPYWCSGVIISSNAILTARHCVTNVWKLPGANVHMIDNKGDDYVKEGLKFSHIYAPAYNQSDYRQAGADIAVITFVKEDVFAGKSAAIDQLLDLDGGLKKGGAKLQLEFITKYLTVNSLQKNSKVSFYKISWGAKKKFEYLSNRYGCKSPSSSFIFKKTTNKYDMYLPEGFNSGSTLDLTYGKVEDAPCKISSKTVNDSWTNYNLFDYGMFNNDQITEEGDSGGPLIACKSTIQDEKLSCDLIGIHSGRNTTTNQSAATNILNPIAAPLIMNVIQSKPLDPNKYNDLIVG